MSSHSGSSLEFSELLRWRARAMALWIRTRLSPPSRRHGRASSTTILSLASRLARNTKPHGASPALPLSTYVDANSSKNTSSHQGCSYLRLGRLTMSESTTLMAPSLSAGMQLRRSASSLFSSAISWSPRKLKQLVPESRLISSQRGSVGFLTSDAQVRLTKTYCSC